MPKGNRVYGERYTLESDGGDIGAHFQWQGVYTVAAVEPEGPAACAGVVEGAVLIGVNRDVIGTGLPYDDVRRLMRAHQGQGGRTRLRFSVGDDLIAAHDRSLGLRLDWVTSLVVTDLVAGAAAADAGVEPGAMVAAVNGQSVEGLAYEEVIEVLQQTKGSPRVITFKQGRAAERTARQLRRGFAALACAAPEHPPEVNIWGASVLGRERAQVLEWEVFNKLIGLSQQPTTYLVHVHMFGADWDMPRRYSDFARLDEQLRANYDEFVDLRAQLPPKVWIGRRRPDVVSFRQCALEEYLQEVVQLFDPFECPALRWFLGIDPSNEPEERAQHAAAERLQASVRRWLGRAGSSSSSSETEAAAATDVASAAAAFADAAVRRSFSRPPIDVPPPSPAHGRGLDSPGKRPPVAAGAAAQAPPALEPAPAAVEPAPAPAVVEPPPAPAAAAVGAVAVGDEEDDDEDIDI